jgi:hypothetical protein
MSIPISLSVLKVAHPADLIRDAIEAGTAWPCGPLPRRLAVWRAGEGAMVKALGPSPASFLNQLLRGRTTDEALAAATAEADPQAALLAIQLEVFAAPFAEIIPIPKEVSS